jgi:cell division protease FtsH
VKQPPRPTWLSSQTRQLSDRPPVLTPAEIAASQNGAGGQNGHLPPPVPADKVIEEQIDEAASVGAHPLAEEHPPEQVIEVPDDQPVNPGEKG